MNSPSEKSKKVCVTGGSGFIASWIIKLLLERGYTVNATVRSLNDPTKTEHLYALDGAKERLHLYEANLLEEGSFDAAMHGCDGVFHTASPVTMGETPNPQVDLIDPAVKGTLNVLKSCKKAPSVKKVILTSSISAVMFNGTPLTDETIVDETWWSSPQVCQEMNQWYLVSKTLAEEAAWKFAKENGIEMVSINPSVVIGPFLQPTPNTSVAAILILINGSSDMYLNATLGWVHVKDVAEAHIRTFELASTSGRYILNESVAHVSEIVKLLSELYPTLKLPHKSSDDQPFPPIFKVSNDKVKSLGIEYIPLKAALKETVECFKEKKFVTI